MFSRSVLKILSRMLIVTFLFSNGCAAMTTGSTQVIAINSTPYDAIATIGGLQIRTPGQVTLKKGSKYVVKVEKPGYEPAQVELERSFNHAFWLNILWGPLLLGVPLVVGTVWDFVSGAAWNITPESVHLTLQEKSAAQQPAAQPQPMQQPK